MYEVFIADCKREMRFKKMKNQDIADATGYSKATIDRFFSNGDSRDKSERVAKEIARVLGLNI